MPCSPMDTSFLQRGELVFECVLVTVVVFWLRRGIGLYHEISWIPHDD